MKINNGVRVNKDEKAHIELLDLVAGVLPSRSPIAVGLFEGG